MRFKTGYTIKNIFNLQLDLLPLDLLTRAFKNISIFGFLYSTRKDKILEVLEDSRLFFHFIVI
ncbi:hypothetical protein GCM10025861_27890 (plasmid) [Methanobacterium petrolearium]|nr:hypothetical protein GCM10025861_27890 [Methanobacterium petrolearium]